MLPLLKRPGPTESERVAELEKEVKHLKLELGAARADAARWEALSNRWEARYGQAINPVLEQETRAQIRYQAALAQAQQQMFYQEAARALNHQNAAQTSGPFQQGAFCNCVPARHDFFLGDQDELF
jgi:hypothetical protein